MKWLPAPGGGIVETVAKPYILWMNDLWMNDDLRRILANTTKKLGVIGLAGGITLAGPALEHIKEIKSPPAGAPLITTLRFAEPPVPQQPSPPQKYEMVAVTSSTATGSAARAIAVQDMNIGHEIRGYLSPEHAGLGGQWMVVKVEGRGETLSTSGAGDRLFRLN